MGLKLKAKKKLEIEKRDTEGFSMESVVHVHPNINTTKLELKR